MTSPNTIMNLPLMLMLFVEVRSKAASTIIKVCEAYLYTPIAIICRMYALYLQEQIRNQKQRSYIFRQNSTITKTTSPKDTPSPSLFFLFFVKTQMYWDCYRRIKLLNSTLCFAVAILQKILKYCSRQVIVFLTPWPVKKVILPHN